MTHATGDHTATPARRRTLLLILCALIALPVTASRAQSEPTPSSSCAAAGRLTPGYTLAPHTPAVAWCYEAGSTIHAVAASGESVFLSTLDGTLIVLDRASGHPRWSSDAGAAFGEIAAGSDLVVGGGSSGVSAWNMSGQPLWTAGTPGPVVALALGDANTVYVACADGTLIGIDGATGAQRWQTPTSILRARLAVSDNDLFAFTSLREVTVAVLDARTGEVRNGWIFDLGPQTYLTTPVVAGKMLVSGYEVIPDGGGQRTGGVVGMEPTTGAIPWNLPLVAPVRVSPAYDGAAVHSLDVNGQLHRLEPRTGQPVRPMEIIESRANAERGTDRLLAIDEGMIYINQPGSAELAGTEYRGVVTATDGTGAALWRFRLIEPPTQPVTASGGDVFIPDGRSLFAIAASSQATPAATPVQ